MRHFALFTLLGFILLLSNSGAYETSDSGFYCNLDPPQADGLRNLTCVNETDFSIASSSVQEYWEQAYMIIPSDYTGMVVDMWVYVGIRHWCAGDMHVDLKSPNNTRVRLSKQNISWFGFSCPTEQFAETFDVGSPYTPIWIDNETSVVSPGDNNDFPGTLESFLGDRSDGVWFLNISDHNSDGPGPNRGPGNFSFWAITMTVNLSTDTTPPAYSQNITSAVDYYNPGALSNFSVAWSDNANSITTAYIENNFTGVLQNATMTGNDLGSNNFIFYYNVTLPAGLFNYTYYAADSFGNWNKSDVYYAGVNRSNSSLLITYIPASTHIYGLSTGAFCNITTGDQTATLKLWFNLTLVANKQGNRSIGGVGAAGIYNGTCQYSESQNYSGLVSYDNILTIRKALPVFNFTLDMAEDNKTISGCYTLNVTAWINISQGQINIYKQNYTHIINPVNGSGNATYTERQCDASGSVLNFTAFYPESQNYSTNNKTFFAFIDSTNPAYSNNISSIQDSVSEDNFSTNFTVTWSDNLNISSALLENNFSGVFVNYTMNGFEIFSYNTSVNSGLYVYRFLSNDTTDLWNSTEYIAFSVQYSAPAPNPPQNRGGGSSGGSGSGTTTTTTTTTTTSTTTTTMINATTTTTTLPAVVDVDNPVNKQESGHSEFNNGGESNNNQSSTGSDIITGAVLVARNPAAVAASLVVLGGIAVNYLVGYDKFINSGKLAKKRALKTLKKLAKMIMR